MTVKSLYLDYNATSPLSQSVQSWLRSGDVLFGNPASQHSAGKASRKIINETRAQLFSIFQKKEKETNLFFHSGATEALTTFAFSFSEWARLSGRDLLICYAKTDHPAVTGLSERFLGSHVKTLELKIDQNLEYLHRENYERIKHQKDHNPNLVILYHHLWVHNETGIVSPLKDLALLKSIPDLYLHVDAVQSPGKVVDWRDLSVGDIWSYSAHKFGSLKGIGFSFYQKPIAFYPLLSGGGQQQSMRSGTENPQGIQSLSLALMDLEKVDVEKTTKLRLKLEEFMNDELKDLGVVVSSRSKLRNSNTIYFYLKEFPSDIALALFDLQGLMISAGSACSSGAAKDSVILTHLGLKTQAKNGLRISFNYALTDEELEQITQHLTTVFSKLRLSLS